MAKTIERKLEELKNVVAIQSDPANALVDEYMRGMANGLILAQAIMDDVEPTYFDALPARLDSAA